MCFCISLCSVIGPVEADPEYQLIVDSNNILVEMDNEISKGYKLTILGWLVHIVLFPYYSKAAIFH